MKSQILKEDDGKTRLVVTVQKAEMLWCWRPRKRGKEVKRMNVIPATSDPTSAEHQIASGISSASAYGPYSEKDKGELHVDRSQLDVWVFFLPPAG